MRLVDSFEHRVAAHLAVILEGLDRLLRHRVHRVRTDQLLDVEDVAVPGFFVDVEAHKTALRQRPFASSASQRGAEKA
jgi:hypothetical protein